MKCAKSENWFESNSIFESWIKKHESFQINIKEELALDLENWNWIMNIECTFDINYLWFVICELINDCDWLCEHTRRHLLRHVSFSRCSSVFTFQFSHSPSYQFSSMLARLAQLKWAWMVPLPSPKSQGEGQSNQHIFSVLPNNKNNYYF